MLIAMWRFSLNIPSPTQSRRISQLIFSRCSLIYEFPSCYHACKLSESICCTQITMDFRVLWVKETGDSSLERDISPRRVTVSAFLSPERSWAWASLPRPSSSLLIYFAKSLHRRLLVQFPIFFEVISRQRSTNVLSSTIQKRWTIPLEMFVETG